MRNEISKKKRKADYEFGNILGTYMNIKNNIEAELVNQISQLKNKMKEYEGISENQSLKIKEIERQRNIYYKIFMEYPYKCCDCDTSFTPETTITKSKKMKMELKSNH